MSAPLPVHSRATERGAAATEYAVLMIVLVPIILYSVFLMDAAYLKIDLQEVVVSGVWDWSTRNTEAFENNEMAGTHDDNQRREKVLTEKMVRMVYSDHTSSFDDGVDPTQPNYNNDAAMKSNLNHEKHHTGFGAQYSFQWMTEDASGNVTGEDSQFACRMSDADLEWAVDPNFKAFGTSEWSTGARVKCQATAYIYNYIVPRDFMPEFSTVSMTDMELREGDAHDFQNAQHTSGGHAADIKVKDTAAISFNTWALRSGAKDGALGDADIGDFNWAGMSPNLAGNPFFERVRHLYAKNALFIATYALIAARGLQFANAARTEELMVVTTIPVPGDAIPGLSLNPLPNIAGVHLTARYKPDVAPVRQKPPGITASWAHQGFQSTPYENVNDDYKTARGNRGKNYMGCRDPETPGCD